MHYLKLVPVSSSTRFEIILEANNTKHEETIFRGKNCLTFTQCLTTLSFKQTAQIKKKN